MKSDIRHWRHQWQPILRNIKKLAYSGAVVLVLYPHTFHLNDFALAPTKLLLTNVTTEPNSPPLPPLQEHKEVFWKLLVLEILQYLEQVHQCYVFYATSSNLFRILRPLLNYFMTEGGLYHKETSQVICAVNQRTGFYMTVTSAMEELIKGNLIDTLWRYS